jgi:hypothetical protein
MRTPETREASGRLVQSHIENILRHGRRPRTRAERHAEREVCYGDHLQTLLGEISEATGRDCLALPS